MRFDNWDKFSLGGIRGYDVRASGTYLVTLGEKMSIEVRPTIKSAPVAVIAQVVNGAAHPPSAKPSQSTPSPTGPNLHSKAGNTQEVTSPVTPSTESKSQAPIAGESAKTPQLPVQTVPMISSTDSKTEDEIKLETTLENEISELWSSQKTKTTALRRSRQKLDNTREELDLAKAKLAEHLYRYKQLLSKPGRGGRWMDFLREVDFPRATADRYVLKHERFLSPKTANRLTEATSTPTHEQIVGLVKKLKPKIVGVLTTTEALAQFVAELSKALDPATIS